jgi:hypothetical protein
MRTFVVVVFVTVMVLAAWANNSTDAVASKASTTSTSERGSPLNLDF